MSCVRSTVDEHDPPRTPENAAPEAPPIPDSPLDAEEVAKDIAEKIAKQSEAYAKSKLLETQKSCQYEFDIRFYDAFKIYGKQTASPACDVDIVKAYFERYKYTVTEVVRDACIFPSCQGRECYHTDKGDYATMRVSLKRAIKDQVDAVKKRLFPETDLPVKKKTSATTRQPPAASAGVVRPRLFEEVTEVRVVPSPEELAVAVPTETPEGGFTVGDESGNCITCSELPAAVMLLPCMHTPCCSMCTTKMLLSSKSCPICTRSITSVLK